MDWHSTKHREELLVVLRGCVQVEAHVKRRSARRVLLRQGQCAFLAERVNHRVVNTARRPATYLYVTAAVV
jgi:mannose-6-phosphate isomerase-like protein (cupin superfamily)